MLFLLMSGRHNQLGLELWCAAVRYGGFFQIFRLGLSPAFAVREMGVMQRYFICGLPATNTTGQTLLPCLENSPDFHPDGCPDWA